MKKSSLLLALLLSSVSAFGQDSIQQRVIGVNSMPGSCAVNKFYKLIIAPYTVWTGGAAGACAPVGTGDAVGPASSTDNAIARFDGTGGKTLQNSGVTIDDSGSVNIPTGQTYKINNVALAKGDVGLGNVDNTSDANKPVSTAQQTALNLKANLISPSFTTPTLGVASATSLQTSGGGVDIKIGGSTSASPALKKNSAALEFRKADDSGYTNIAASYLLLYQPNPAGSAASAAFSQDVELSGNGEIRWNSSTNNYILTSQDVGLGRAAAGVLKITNGSTGYGKISTAASVTWSSGSGSPEGVLTANIGSLYTRTDGGAGTTLYVKESGTGNTGWVAK